MSDYQGYLDKIRQLEVPVDFDRMFGQVKSRAAKGRRRRQMMAGMFLFLFLMMAGFFYQHFSFGFGHNGVLASYILQNDSASEDSFRNYLAMN